MLRAPGVTLLERYEVQRVLSQGADRAVYLVRDGENGKLVALKQMHLDGTGWRPEANTLQRLRHPHLPRVYDHFELEGYLHVVMDYIDGGSLADVVDCMGPREEADMLELIKPVCQALAYLHQQGMQFGDLKPANILQDDTGTVMLVGFGFFAGPHDLRRLGETMHFLLSGMPPDGTPLEELAEVSRETRETIAALLSDQPPASIEEVMRRLSLESQETDRVPVGEEATQVPPSAATRRTEPTRDARVGDVLNNRYRIERVLGRGGMGAVYLAYHLELEEPVAIKVMQPPPLDDEMREACERQFRIEARILNRLRHPNLPRVYDFFEVLGSHYLVMDYIRGGTLDMQPTPTEETARKWAGELCEVLHYLHSQDPPVIFRDLKPANIMLADDGSIRLIDFGIAKVFEPEQGASTRTILQGAVSQGYAAPEQYGGGGTDARVDIYALGATLYYLLGREVPPASMDVASGIASLTPLSTLKPGLSGQTYAAIEWMMALVRDMRPRDMLEVRRALGLSGQDEPVAASVPQRMKQLLREEFQHFFPAPFVARPSLLDRVLGVLGGGPTTLALSGAAGCGKTRLLLEATSRLSGTRRVLPFVRGSRMTRSTPFGGLVVPCRTLLESHANLTASLASSLDETALHELSQLLPELRPVAPSTSTRVLAPMDRTTILQESFATFFALLAAEGNLPVLVVDDAQWIDSATLRMLDVIQAESSTSRLQLVLIHDASEPEGLEQQLSRWRLRGEVTEVVVGPFTRAEVQTWMQQTLPPVLGLESHLPTLYSVTGGNPLFLEELVRWLVVRRVLDERNGALVLRDVRAESLPQAVDDALRRRLDLLPLDSQELLGQASVIGLFFAGRVLEKLSSERPQVISESLSRAYEAMFIRPLENGWEFVSEATREAFYSRLSASHRRQLHLALGRLDEETPGAATTAFHFEQGGDIAKSIEYLSRFARDMLTPNTVEIVVREKPGAKQWSNTTPLDDEQLESVQRALAYMVRTIKSSAAFGLSSPVTQTSLGLAVALFREVQLTVGPLLVSCTDAMLFLNDREIEIRNAPPELPEMFRRHRVSGFELRPGIVQEQMLAFIELLNGPREAIVKLGGWSKALSERGCTCVQLIESVLVEVSERDLFDPSRLKQASEIRMRDENGEPTELRPWANAPTPAPAGSAGELGPQLESIRELLQMQASGAIRLPGVADESASSSILTEDREVADAWDSLSKQAQKDEIIKLVVLSRTIDLPLMAYLESRPDLLVADLEAADRERRLLAAMGLLKQAQRARRPLLNYLAASDHTRGRAVALFLLTQMVSDVPALIISRLVESATESEVINLLRAMQEGGLPWVRPLEVLLRSSSSTVRRATAQFVLTAGAVDFRDRMEILRPPLQSENPLVVRDVLMAIGDLGREEMVPDVAKLLDRGWTRATPEQIAMQVQACYALGRIGTSESALPVLKSVLSRSVATAIKGLYDTEVRAAAAWAAGRIKGAESTALLQSLLKDPDPGVRGAARLALDTPEPTVTRPNKAEVQERLP